MPECTTKLSKKKKKTLYRHSRLSWTFQIQFYFIQKRKRKNIKNLKKACYRKLIFDI